MTVLCWRCRFCDGHIHVRAADLAACVALAASSVDLHLETHVAEMAAETVA